MKVFDCATEQIEQGGKRRGANMGILQVDHPDIEEFIDAKRERGALRNFNVSVAATDAFMEAVAAGEPYALLDPRTGEREGRRDAAAMFDKIAEAAWKTGDPGLFFIDAANRAHPLSHLGELEGTNPCGEIPLFPYESCNLGSVNLSRFVRERSNGTPELDRDGLADTVRTGLRFLDDVIEVNRFPLPETERATRRNRKIGLGVMGFAEALVRLGVPYDSDRALEVADSIASLVAGAAREASIELAEERGTFPSWEGSRHEREGVRIRNATTTAVAPTGTIGIIAGTSPSIEPFFSLAFRQKNVLSGQTLRRVNPLAEAWAERYGLDLQRLMVEVRRHGIFERGADVPAELRQLFLTAGEIRAERHLAVQAAFQRHFDNAVSKTLNLPEHAEVENVRTIYRRAWELNLEGVTVSRYGSLGEQVLERGTGDDT